MSNQNKLTKAVEIVGLPNGYFKTESFEELQKVCNANEIEITGFETRAEIYGGHCPAFIIESNGWDWKIGSPKLKGVCGVMKGANDSWRFETWKAYEMLSR